MFNPIIQVSRKVEKDKTSSYECQGPVEDDCDHEQIRLHSSSHS